MKNILLLTFLAGSFVIVNTAFSQADPNFYNAYADVLKQYVNEQGMVNYNGLKQNHSGLDSFSAQIAHLGRAEFDKWPDNDKIAFWLNAYNALTLKTIIEHYPIKPSFIGSLISPKNSIRQIPGAWDRIKFDIMGRQMTLDQIEHKTLRAQFNEPRIHMALVCASVGCPPLRNEPYLGEKLDSQLDDQARRFLSNPQKFRIDRDKHIVYLSLIFEWFGPDFEKKYVPAVNIPGQNREASAVINFIARHVDKNDSEYLYTGKYRVDFLKYDWSLNELQ